MKKFIAILIVKLNSKYREQGVTFNYYFDVKSKKFCITCDNLNLYLHDEDFKTYLHDFRQKYQNLKFFVVCKTVKMS